MFKLPSSPSTATAVISLSAQNTYVYLLYDIRLRTANHELNHFMFHHYYGDLERGLGGEKWNVLKERMTFFTEPNSPGYPAEKELRKLYLSRRWKDVDEIVEAGKELLLK